MQKSAILTSRQGLTTGGEKPILHDPAIMLQLLKFADDGEEHPVRAAFNALVGQFNLANVAMHGLIPLSSRC